MLALAINCGAKSFFSSVSALFWWVLRNTAFCKWLPQRSFFIDRIWFSSGKIYPSDDMKHQRNLINFFGVFVLIFAIIVLYLVGNPGYQRSAENEVEHVPLSERWFTSVSFLSTTKKTKSSHSHLAIGVVLFIVFQVDLSLAYLNIVSRETQANINLISRFSSRIKIIQWIVDVILWIKIIFSMLSSSIWTMTINNRCCSMYTRASPSSPTRANNGEPG